MTLPHDINGKRAKELPHQLSYAGNCNYTWSCQPRSPSNALISSHMPNACNNLISMYIGALIVLVTKVSNCSRCTTSTNTIPCLLTTWQKLDWTRLPRGGADGWVGAWEGAEGEAGALPLFLGAIKKHESLNQPKIHPINQIKQSTKRIQCNWTNLVVRA